jgi:uncharacterized membrane protein (DUF373 family)
MVAMSAQDIATTHTHENIAKTWFRWIPSHVQIVKALVSATMVLLYLWIASGLYAITQILFTAPITQWAKGAESMIVEIVTILAILELIRTLQSYLSLGRVRVTFILDAALVVLIGELIGLSFLHYSPEKIILHLAVIIALGILRLLTVRISPNHERRAP